MNIGPNNSLNITMTEAQDNVDQADTLTAGNSKRPYTKPAFRHETVFETMALACGKMRSTQRQCRSNVRNS